MVAVTRVVDADVDADVLVIVESEVDVDVEVDLADRSANADPANRARQEVRSWGRASS